MHWLGVGVQISSGPQDLALPGTWVCGGRVRELFRPLRSTGQPLTHTLGSWFPSLKEEHKKELYPLKSNHSCLMRGHLSIVGEKPTLNSVVPFWIKKQPTIKKLSITTLASPCSSLPLCSCHPRGPEGGLAESNEGRIR